MLNVSVWVFLTTVLGQHKAWTVDWTIDWTPDSITGLEDEYFKLMSSSNNIMEFIIESRVPGLSCPNTMAIETQTLTFSSHFIQHLSDTNDLIWKPHVIYPTISKKLFTDLFT